MTHLGTFGTELREAAGWAQAWTRKEEMEFVNCLTEDIVFVLIPVIIRLFRNKVLNRRIITLRKQKDKHDCQCTDKTKSINDQVGNTRCWNLYT